MADLNIPEGLHYTKDDEWIRVEGDTGTIGITDYAQDQLSDIVYVEHPDVGDSFGQGDIFGVVESVKAAGDMTMPVGGEVIEINEALADDPEVVNGDPYGSWFIKVKLSDPSELDDLMDAVAYKAYCEERA
jgi:glycine cleavage system H protein